MKLQERVNNFLSELGVPLTVFSKKVSLSTAAIRNWQKGILNLSDNACKRIDEYLSKYGF